MRKQTKLVAVLSAAALLAMGASMTSFAAGWEKDDAGIWHFYDKDDEMVTGEWKKDGGKWFYLDDDGEMATDQWVDDEYYVGEDGAMLINTWKKTLADEDMDDPEDDGESWYYFGSKGKKTVSGDKKINGKTYFFDENGKMQDGWYEQNGDVYYLGDEDDGARKSGWLWLEVPDEDDNIITGHTDDGDMCDEEGWYYFGSNGKMYKDFNKKKVNGKYYFFNKHGQMLYEWINGSPMEAGTPTNAVADGKVPEASASSAQAGNMIYANQVEEGWRADGWYEIDGAEDTGASDDTDWYYFKDGKAKCADKAGQQFTYPNGGKTKSTAKIKVNGKYFCFNEIGQMQTGLQYIPDAGGFYYFDDNGYMKTGKVSNVEEDNDSFTYYFNTKNGKNGLGVTGEKSGYLYWNGKRLEADDDYRIYKLPNSSKTAWEYYLVNKSGKLQKSDKKYDVENGSGAEDVEFTFNGYKITGLKTGSPACDYVTDATTPQIELYDGTMKPIITTTTVEE